MKSAAGVILIIAALFNLFASFGYLAVGAATSGMGSVMEQAVQGEGVPSQAQEIDTSDVKVAGAGLFAYGILLLVSVGILIAGAVFLFQGRNAKFIMVAAVMAILMEVVGMVLTELGVLKLLGIVGGVLALVAAKGIGSPGPDSESA
jgi:hypothetical protein